MPEADTPRTRSGVPAFVSAAENESKAASSEKTWLVSRRQSRKLAGATQRAGLSGDVSQAMTSRSASAKGNGRSSTCRTTPKMAVVAPTPRPIDRMAAAASSGA